MEAGRVVLQSRVPATSIVRSEEKPEEFPTPKRPNLRAKPLLWVAKPSWVVRTESNVRKERRKIPEPPCEICHGSGKVDCHQCFGRGRLNHTGAAVLPKGEWPKWCRSCGGSGLAFCSRCLGTGEYRYIMGFHFMDRNSGYGHPSRR